MEEITSSHPFFHSECINLTISQRQFQPSILTSLVNFFRRAIVAICFSTGDCQKSYHFGVLTLALNQQCLFSKAPLSADQSLKQCVNLSRAVQPSLLSKIQAFYASSNRAIHCFMQGVYFYHGAVAVIHSFMPTVFDAKATYNYPFFQGLYETYNF